MILLTLLTALSAQAADHELSFEVGTLGATDPAFELFSENDSLTTLGLRAGVAVHDRVAVIASWQHGGAGSTVSSTAPYAQAMLFVDEFTLGAKVDYTFWEFLQPYASLQGVFLRSHIRLDDDPQNTDTGSKLTEAGLTGGGVGALGLELRVPQLDRIATAAVYAEVGYALTAQATYGELGDMHLGGLHFRSGLGVRF